MRSTNPVFSSLERSQAYVTSETASYRGIMFKTGFLLMIAVLTGYLSLMYLPIEQLLPLIGVSAIVGFISVLVATRSVRLAPVFSVLYAASEGVLLGLITFLVNTEVPGAATAALLATGAIFTVMLFLYSSRTIRVTPTFRRIMYSIILGILFFIVIQLILGIFGINLQLTSGVALLVSGIFIVVGALMLTLDFDRAEMIVSGGMDRAYEWMVAVGLMVTIVWIYVELLRFILILSSRRN